MSTEQIAESFRNLDFHDDTFVDFRVSPPRSRGDASQSVIEIRLRQYSKRAIRVLRFSGCSNLKVSFDFDVLAHNLPPNTSDVDAHTNLNRMRDLMETQKGDWGVEYGPNAVSPLNRKLAAAGDLVSFRVQLFGGAIEIVARSFEVETIDDK
jgi:hypothetical protein